MKLKKIALILFLSIGILILPKTALSAPLFDDPVTFQVGGLRGWQKSEI